MSPAMKFKWVAMLLSHLLNCGDEKRLPVVLILHPFQQDVSEGQIWV